jgi:hypothetical protein
MVAVIAILAALGWIAALLLAWIANRAIDNWGEALKGQRRALDKWRDSLDDHARTIEMCRESTQMCHKYRALVTDVAYDLNDWIANRDGDQLAQSIAADLSSWVQAQQEVQQSE